MIGGNLPENRGLENKLLTNEEVLAVNQLGEQPQLLVKTDSSSIWMSKADGGKSRYVAIFNLGGSAASIALPLTRLGLSGKLTARDLWKKTDLGILGRQFAPEINAHGTVLLKISVKAGNRSTL